jgi:hypothetical protein
MHLRSVSAEGEHYRQVQISIELNLFFRICPGMHFADATLFITLATMLTVFDIKPAKDAQGNDIIPKAEMGANLLIRCVV